MQNRILTDTLPGSISGLVNVDCTRNLWREDWRIPSFYEMTELVLKCQWTPYTYKGVKGYRGRPQWKEYLPSVDRCDRRRPGQYRQLLDRKIEPRPQQNGL